MTIVAMKPIRAINQTSRNLNVFSGFLALSATGHFASAAENGTPLHLWSTKLLKYHLEDFASPKLL
jgi:hypothetical protein